MLRSQAEHNDAHCRASTGRVIKCTEEDAVSQDTFDTCISGCMSNDFPRYFQGDALLTWRNGEGKVTCTVNAFVKVVLSYTDLFVALRTPIAA